MGAVRLPKILVLTIDVFVSAQNGGKTFDENWAYAHAVGPRIAFVQSFNQWSGCDAKPGENMNEEYSTDIEPMEGGHGDHYLLALGKHARAFKATAGPVPACASLALLIS